MIFLIDDKRNRQKGYGWSQIRLKKYASLIKPVYSADELFSLPFNTIFEGQNTILIHDSFIDSLNSFGAKSQFSDFLAELHSHAEENADLNLILFSGSINTRSLSNCKGFLPVSILYQNLETFVDKCAQSENDLRYLFFGINPDLEETFREQLKHANNRLVSPGPLPEISSKNLILRTKSDFIDKSLPNADYQFLSDIEVTDVNLHTKINDWLNDTRYDNIFLPLCFGASLSDLNGLRLATHIRCTDSYSQVANIFIYGFLRLTELLKNDFFDILKTKNVYYIDYSISSIIDSLAIKSKLLPRSEIATELRKLNFQPPGNYEDSHSVANEWAAHRWGRALNVKEVVFEKISDKVNSNIYYKYLNTCYPKHELNALPKNELKVEINPDVKILYIDDEADKGWLDIFCTLLADINHASNFDYLCEELKGKSPSQIVETSLSKIREGIDIVILDFRLHPDDFIRTKTADITGYQLLRAIKGLNPGIQVIIFSATTKILYLQDLLDAGADDFIVKESPELAFDNKFTKRSIVNCIKTISLCAKMTFLTKSYTYLESIKNNIENVLNRATIVETVRRVEYSVELFAQMEIVFECGLNYRRSKVEVEQDRQLHLNLAFLSCYKLIEILARYFTSETGSLMRWTNEPVRRYNPRSSELIEIQTGDKVHLMDKLASILLAKEAIDIRSLYKSFDGYREIRNSIIHPKNNTRLVSSKEVVKFLGKIDELFRIVGQP